MTVIIDGGAGVTFPDTVQQTNAVTNTGGSPRYYATRAWVNFKGTSTVTIRAAANVSSITDNGTGDYTVNFTTAMPDANYSVVAMPSSVDASSNNIAFHIQDGGVYTTSAVQILCEIASGANQDCTTACVIVIR
jgi:hypothetical protein